MDFFAHFVVVFVVGLAVFGREHWKKILFFSLLALLPDLDFVFSMHKQLFHNIFFAIMVGLAVFAVSKKLWKEKAKAYGLLGFFAVLSHLVMDLGKPGLALFWPLYDKAVFFQAELKLYKTTVFPYIEFGTTALSDSITSFSHNMQRMLLSKETFFIAVVFAAALLVAWKLQNRKKPI